MRFLVPVDGSPNSWRAFNEALQLINKENDHLLLLNVMEDMMVYAAFPDAPMSAYSVYSAAQEHAKTEAKKLLLKYSHVCIDREVPYTSLSVVSNHVGDAVCSVVDERHIDFVVIGRRGMSKLKRFFIGSTSRYVVETANCNVIVVKEEANPVHETQTIAQQQVVVQPSTSGKTEVVNVSPSPVTKSDVGTQKTEPKVQVVPPANPSSQ